MSTKVLVIDDDRAIVDMVQLSLLLDGYDVSTAGNGEEGLAVAREVRPNVVVLDVMMPGMDGLTVARHMRADPLLARIPIVIATARVSATEQRAGWQEGIDSYVTKPFDIEVLHAEIERVVREAALEGQHPATPA